MIKSLYYWMNGPFPVSMMWAILLFFSIFMSARSLKPFIFLCFWEMITNIDNSAIMSEPSIKEEPYVTQSLSRQPSLSSADDYSSGATDEIVSSLVEQTLWPSSSHHEQVVHPLDPTLFLDAWDPNSFPSHLNVDDWDLAMHPQEQHSTLMNDIQKTNQSNYTLSVMPQTPPVHNYNYANNITATMLTVNDFGYSHNAFTGDSANMIMSTSNSGLVTPPLTNYYPPRHSLPTPNNKKYGKMLNGRRCSVETARYGRRASSHPSVASVVSLTAHEPVSKIVDGIEYITFLYSHDRLVKEYTVRTDVDHVNLDDISMDFRTQNAVSLMSSFFC